MAKRSISEAEKRNLSKENLVKILRIFNYLKIQKSTFVIGLIALILSTFPIMAFPKLAGELLDAANGKSVYFNSVDAVALTLLLLFLLQAGFSFIRVYTFSIVSEKGLANLRVRVFEKLLYQSMTFFDSRRVGELMSRVTSDVATLQDTFSFTLAELLRQLLTLLTGIILLFVFAPDLTIFMLLTFPVLIVAALIFGRYIRKISKLTQDKLAETNVVIEESLQNIHTVKSFTNEVFNLTKYKSSIATVVKTALRTSRMRGFFISFTIFTIFGGIVAVGWLGAKQIQSGGLQTGELFSFIIYTAMIGFSIAGIGDIYSQIQRSIGASERILEILDLQDEKEPEQPSARFEGNIGFHITSFAYPSRPDFRVLSNLHLDIKKGEKIALIGKSGSGKSTIVSLLLRFYEVTDGEISIDGEPIKTYPLAQVRNNIGIVPQEVLLFGGTIRENIAYGKPGATEAEIIAAAKTANALDFILSFPEKFDTIVGDRGVKLSGGQRQRIAIARTVLKNPAILVLDEATSALDAESEAEVQIALEKIMEGRTSIIIAHRLSTIKKADRIFVIEEGTVSESGTPAELSSLDSGIYAKLLKIQWQ